MAEVGEGKNTRSQAFDFTKSFTVNVGTGDAQQSFHLHEAFFTNRSSFFAAAISQRWTQSEARVVELPEDNPIVFNCYLHCVYNGSLNLDDLSSHRDGSRSLKGVFNRCIPTYILADKLGDCKSANLIMDLFITYWYPGGGMALEVHDVTRIYNNTTEASPLRKLLVEWSACNLTTDFFDDLPDSEDIPASYWRDVLKETAQKFDNVQKNDMSKGFKEVSLSEQKARYHQHDSRHPATTVQKAGSVPPFSFPPRFTIPKAQLTAAHPAANPFIPRTPMPQLSIRGRLDG